MTIPADLRCARALLERAAASADASVKVASFEEALDLLDACVAEGPSDIERATVSNLRLAHTRSLLGELPSLGALPFQLWFEFINLLFVRLKDEVAQSIQGQPQLGEKHRSFVRLWRSELLDLISENDT